MAVARGFLKHILAALWFVVCGAAWAAQAPSPVNQRPGASPGESRDRTLDQLVQAELLPQLDFLFEGLVKEKAALRLDGVPALNAADKFLPGKIAVGIGHLVLASLPRDPQKARRYLAGYRDIADLTVGMDNHTWGIYYYLQSLHRLKAAGLLGRAVQPATLARLKRQLDWRSFVRTSDLTLINLPTNYYGVAFSVARLRFLLGWEDESGSKALLAKMLEHYRTYSGAFGFSDETAGEGRFDRYSVLLSAEICERFIETGLPVTEELKGLLRKSADVALRIANDRGDGFSFGRSLGPYGDTAALEILTTAAHLGVLSAEEKDHAYTYALRIVGKYVDFWFDPKTHSVNLWDQGRRTDAYRAKHRILGENFSLLHQMLSANELWSRSGYKNRRGRDDLQAWLDRTQPAFALTWFARGEYDRALAVFRDRGSVFSLLMVNGGAGQHANAPYYPLPFAQNLISGTPDSGAEQAQLLPKFRLADGSELLPTAFIKDIQASGENAEHELRFRQDELTLLGNARPVKDARIQLRTVYRFAPGRISREDTYTAVKPLQVERLSLDFATFSEDGSVDGKNTHFKAGRVEQFEVQGLDACRVEPTLGRAQDQAPEGPMKSHVRCESTKFEMTGPITVKWTLSYR